MNFYHLKERGLTLDKLLAFVAVARAGSVAEAAKGVESRRSLMSRQVGELESALGVELFLRKGKSLEITTAGRELALLSAAYFEEIEGLSARFSGNKGLLKLGAGAAVLEAMVFPAIRTLRRSLPDCRFEFIPDSTRGVGQRLHDGSLDIGIVRASYEDGGLIRKSCGTMKFVLVGRRDFDSKLPSWTITQFLSRVPMALIRGEGSLVTTLQEMASVVGTEMVATSLADNFGHVKQLLLFGQPGGLLPVVLARDLPKKDFHVLDDDALDALDRPLEVVIEKRAARVRDRLEVVAEAVTKAIATR
jgi:DNA-binding transcriptional LysR family regulator